MKKNHVVTLALLGVTAAFGLTEKVRAEGLGHSLESRDSAANYELRNRVRLAERNSARRVRRADADRSLRQEVSLRVERGTRAERAGRTNREELAARGVRAARVERVAVVDRATRGALDSRYAVRSRAFELRGRAGFGHERLAGGYSWGAVT